MAIIGEWDDCMMLCSSPACAVPVVSLFHPTPPTCVLPACEHRWTSPKESLSKSQCTSANSVKGPFQVFTTIWCLNSITSLLSAENCWQVQDILLEKLQRRFLFLSAFMQVFTASSHLGAVCPWVKGIAGTLPEKNQELHDQSKCDSY